MNFITNHTKIIIKDGKTGLETTLLDTKNGKIGKVVAGIPFIDVIDDSLDSFVFTIKNVEERKPFMPYSLVTFTIDDGNGEENIYLFVLFDKVQTYSRVNNTYQHTVSCVETAKILEKIKIFNLTMTNPNDSLLEQFNKACTNVEPFLLSLAAESVQTNARYLRFHLSDNLNKFLENKPSRDFYFSNTDFRTICDEMLSGYNARVTVDSVEYDSDGLTIKRIYLGYIAMDKLASEIEPVWDKENQGEIVFEEAENDGQNYAGKIVARGYNSIAENALDFTDTFKAASYRINSETATIFLPFPVSDRAFKRIAVNVDATYYDKDNKSLTRNYKVDVTSCFIPQESFDLLNEETAKRYIPYQIGSQQINVGKTYSDFLGYITQSTLQAVIESKVPTEITEAGSIFYRAKVSEFWVCPFTCSYYPLIDTVCEMNKPNVYDKNTLLMGIMDSQTEKMLDIDRHGKKLLGLIKRTGNTEYVMDVKAKYHSKLLPIMSRIDLPNATSNEERDFVLYKREYSVFDNFINCRYYFSQHYNAIQANAGVNREKHLYDIPLESDETPLIVKKYLMFSYNEDFEKKDLSFSSYCCYSALGALVGKNETLTYTDNSTEKTAKGKIKYLLLQTWAVETDENGTFYKRFPEKDTVRIGDEEIQVNPSRFALPVANYVHANTMNFIARPLDNYSISYARDGYEFSLLGNAGHKIVYNQYVSTQEGREGECDRFVLDYVFEAYGLEDVKTLPLAGKDRFVSAMNISGAFDSLHYVYKKDRAQRPLFVLSFEFLPVEKYKNDIIIGPKFIETNNLVRDNETFESLFLRVSQTKTFNGDEVRLPADYETSPRFNSYSAFTLKKPVGKNSVKLACAYQNSAHYTGKEKSWALVNQNGDIYLAGNGVPRDIYVQICDLLA